MIADWDDAYNNRDHIPGADAFIPRWQAAAAAFRAALGARADCDIACGPGPRQRFDLFHPASNAAGLAVFVHGGYWRAFDKSFWSHLAAGALAHGWAVAMPSYTLAPEARLAEMTIETGRAVDAAAARVSGPVVVTGHSAGGHLSARMGCAGAPVTARVARVVPISPLADLVPLRATVMNDILRIDAAEARAESPARLARAAGVGAHVWVGAMERPAFLWQARLLSEEWGCPWTAAPGRHHFDVIDDLADPGSGLIEACLGGL